MRYKVQMTENKPRFSRYGMLNKTHHKIVNGCKAIRPTIGRQKSLPLSFIYHTLKRTIDEAMAANAEVKVRTNSIL